MAEDSEKFYNFLQRYDLHRYHQKFVDMGVRKISHLKDVDDNDLELVGLSRPERSRLRKKLENNFSFAGRLRVRYPHKRDSRLARHGKCSTFFLVSFFFGGRSVCRILYSGRVVNLTDRPVRRRKKTPASCSHLRESRWSSCRDSFPRPPSSAASRSRWVARSAKGLSGLYTKLRVPMLTDR